MPEPLSWVHKTDFGGLMFSCSPTVPPWSFPVYTEAQLREALANHEATLRQALELLGPEAPECCGCRAEWDMAIKALEDGLK